MDKGSQDSDKPAVVITGLGHVVPGTSPDFDGCDPRRYLKVRKNRKFMAKQDDLALVAAGRALESAGLRDRSLGEKTGLFIAVGYLPFGENDIDLLARSSIDEGSFSMDRFSTAGMDSVNPLLTFHCLPNMAAFHISVNFDIQGTYFVTYPGPGQFYSALESACHCLEEERIDIALVVGVAHQQNFLVQYHFARVDRPVLPARLVDASGCIILEALAHARERSAPIRGRLLDLQVSYQPHNPFESSVPYAESVTTAGCSNLEPLGRLGAASLPVTLSVAAAAGGRSVEHSLQSGDGIVAASRWDLS